VLRTRVSTAGANQTPDPADFEAAAQSRVPLFIVGQWSNPPVVWEVLRDGDDTSYRVIDGDGWPGPWRARPQ
jgi:hypothetical protein